MTVEPQGDIRFDVEGAPLRDLYKDRRGQEDLEFRKKVWEILCARVFQRYVDPSDTVLDLGAGWCEFINSIECSRRIAVDMNHDLPEHAGEARAIVTPSTDLSPVADQSVDVVFTSNLLEHMPNKAAVLQTLRECRRVLRHGGQLLVVMPNIRYLSKRYWDYFDHMTPLSHVSLTEGMRLAGFEIVRVVPRFVPYLVKSRFIPKTTMALRAYLRLPLVWPLFGRQMFVVGRRLG